MRGQRSISMARPEQKRRGHGDDLCLRVPSALSAIEPVCEEIRAVLQERHLEKLQFSVELVARECLNNAIRHGNRGRATGWVSFAMRVSRKRICLRIADQGPGFDWQTRTQSWPQEAAAGGRGLMIASTIARRIAFNARGNQVTLWINTAREER